MMPNAVELELLTGEKDYCKGADALIGKGVKIVAVKLGGDGCYVTDGRERHLIEAFKVKVVDTTGAGDAFCAGFLYGLLNNKSLYECGRLGNFVASRCVMKMGAQNRVALRQRLSSFLAKCSSRLSKISFPSPYCGICVCLVQSGCCHQ